jgi:hypothetical protein
MSEFSESKSFIKLSMFLKLLFRYLRLKFFDMVSQDLRDLLQQVKYLCWDNLQSFLYKLNQLT